MALVSLEQARSHLRVDDPAEDSQIALYLAAAEQAAFDYLNRNAYPDEETLAAAVGDGTAGDRPIVANAAILSAVLLMLGHLWENREDSIVGTIVSPLPNGSKWLLTPHRIGMGA